MKRFHPVRRPGTFRKLAAAMWRHPRDPSIYGSMDVDATVALAYLKEYREREGVRVTMSHLVAMATARAFAEHPECNAKIRFGGQIVQREVVDISLHVSTDGGRDLAAALIEEADRRSLKDVAEELNRQAASIRSGHDENLQRTRGLFQRLPWWLTRPTLDLTDLLTNELHVHLPELGLRRDPFGAAMVTNVGMFGIDTGFAPLAPISRCPLILLVPEVRERPWIVDGEVVPRPILRLCATFDHRVIDGFHAGKLAESVKRFLQAPASMEAAPRANAMMDGVSRG
jgi:pyruvate/2-oxoglutarate dehydrogenase complex dihydrolipoamide acyltransferase (E2) component